MSSCFIEPGSLCFGEIPNCLLLEFDLKCIVGGSRRGAEFESELPSKDEVRAWTDILVRSNFFCLL